MKIDKNSKLSDLLKNIKGASRVFESFNMGCSSCQGRSYETLEWGATMHGIDPDLLMQNLKNLVDNPDNQKQ